MFTIDGLSWDVPCSIERVAELTASDISGMLLDKSYFNDVLGTFMRYTLTLAVPFNRENEYTQIYEALTAPVDGHTFVFPYNQETLTITGRVSQVSDVYVRMQGGGTHWKGVRFDITANHPTKTMSLSDVLTRGRAPLPEVASVAVGTVYEYTENGWVPASFTDGDSIAW